MNRFATALLLPLTLASNVHEFFAESNYICQLCQTAIEMDSHGNDESLEKIYEMFPAFQERIARVGTVKHMLEIYDAEDPKGTCERLDLCEAFDVAAALKGEEPLDLDIHIELVNQNANSTWVAGKNDKFHNASKKEVQQILGTIVDPEWTLKDFNLYESPAAVYADDLPANFDAREHWADCASTINTIHDQSNCGSCWAHGTTEAFNDRKCIVTEGKFTTLLSMADTTGCCNFVQCQSMGCNGGHVGSPWRWFMNKGVVSGGDKGDGRFCYDYTMDKCNHHQPTSTLPECDDIKKDAPKCHSECQTNTTINYHDDKVLGSSSYGFGLFGATEKIKQDIFTNGPVTAAFTVFEDFLTYKSGVYQHTTGKKLGGHAIKVIGWGNESDTDYWLVVNSWNATWGDKGLFKIKMGNCGIDNQMHAGLVE